MPDEIKRKKTIVSEAVAQRIDKSGAKQPELSDPTIHVTDSGLNISTVDRVCTGKNVLNEEIPPPATNIPTDTELFSSKEAVKVDLSFMKNHFIHEGRLSNSQALEIIKKATVLLKAEPTLLDLEAPLTGLENLI